AAPCNPRSARRAAPTATKGWNKSRPIQEGLMKPLSAHFFHSTLLPVRRADFTSFVNGFAHPAQFGAFVVWSSAFTRQASQPSADRLKPYRCNYTTNEHE